MAGVSRGAGTRLDDPAGRWVITGTGSGLGAALAGLVESEIGATVTGVDRHEHPPPGPTHRIQADLATREGVDAVLDHLRDWQPTVFVNCAATNQSRHVIDTDDDLLSEVVQVGLRAPYEFMREMGRLADQSTEHRWVVNIVSPYRLVGIRTHSLYCATKAAMSRAGESLAAESLDLPLSVVSVVPGAFNSSFRPVESHDAWLVRTYRRHGARTPDAVAVELLRRLRRRSRRRHRTIRLGWDGKAFEAGTRLAAGDVFLDALDRLIGQRAADGDR